jgi:hypothetical protein
MKTEFGKDLADALNEFAPEGIRFSGSDSDASLLATLAKVRKLPGYEAQTASRAIFKELRRRGVVVADRKPARRR